MDGASRRAKAAKIRRVMDADGPAVAQNTVGFNEGRSAAVESLSEYEAVKERAFEAFVPHLEAGRTIAFVEPTDLAMVERECEKLGSPSDAAVLPGSSRLALDVIHNRLQDESDMTVAHGGWGPCRVAPSLSAAESGSRDVNERGSHEARL